MQIRVSGHSFPPNIILKHHATDKERESAMGIVINDKCRCLNKGEPREMKCKTFYLISLLKIFS